MWTKRDQRAYNVAYYARNRATEIERVRVRQAATLEFLRHLRRVPCRDCGGLFKPHQMDFDHRDPAAKSFGLTWPRALLASRANLLVEVAKCDVVCANCHSVRTYGLHALRKAERRASGALSMTPRRTRQRLREAEGRELILRLRDRPCMDCGQRFARYVMQFDHREPATKLFNVSESWLKSAATILGEAAKCDIVCANCHRDRTFRRRQDAGVAQLAEREFSKLDVAGSNPVSRSDIQPRLIEEAAVRYAA